MRVECIFAAYLLIQVLKKYLTDFVNISNRFWRYQKNEESSLNYVRFIFIAIFNPTQVNFQSR